MRLISPVSIVVPGALLVLVAVVFGFGISPGYAVPVDDVDVSACNPDLQSCQPTVANFDRVFTVEPGTQLSVIVRFFRDGDVLTTTPFFAENKGTASFEQTFHVDAPSGATGFADVVGVRPIPGTPEPTTLLLFGTTAAGLGLVRWRRRRQS